MRMEVVNDNVQISVLSLTVGTNERSVSFAESLNSSMAANDIAQTHLNPFTTGMNESGVLPLWHKTPDALRSNFCDANEGNDVSNDYSKLQTSSDSIVMPSEKNQSDKKASGKEAEKINSDDKSYVLLRPTTQNARTDGQVLPNVSANQNRDGRKVSVEIECDRPFILESAKANSLVKSSTNFRSGPPGEEGEVFRRDKSMDKSDKGTFVCDLTALPVVSDIPFIPTFVTASSQNFKHESATDSVVCPPLQRGIMISKMKGTKSLNALPAKENDETKVSVLGPPKTPQPLEKGEMGTSENEKKADAVTPFSLQETLIPTSILGVQHPDVSSYVLKDAFEGSADGKIEHPAFRVAPPLSSHPAETQFPLVGNEHRTLMVTPTALEVGVPEGTHGWVRVRAEITDEGAIHASVSPSSSNGAEVLRRELPLLTTYLQQEHISVSTLVVHEPSKTQEFSGMSGGMDLSRESGQNLNDSQNEQGRSPASFNHDDFILRSTDTEEEKADWLPPPGRRSVGWLSVRA